jgi:hypothetical protein
MALAVGTNSYVSQADADSHFGDRLDVAAWTNATDLMKQQALITASMILDEQSWLGTALTDTQAMAFPRSFAYYDQKYGDFIIVDGITIVYPDRLLKGTMELAYHFLNNSGVNDTTGTSKNMTVGSVSLEQIRVAPVIPLNVRNIIKPLLVNNGSNAWWRAN